MFGDLNRYIDLVGVKSRVMRCNWVFVAEESDLTLKLESGVSWAIWRNETISNQINTVGLVHFTRTVSQGRMYKIVKNIKKLSTIIDYEVALSYLLDESDNKSKINKIGKVPKFNLIKNNPFANAGGIANSTARELEYQARKDIKALKSIIEAEHLKEDEVWEIYPYLMSKYWRYFQIKEKLKIKINKSKKLRNFK